jgi:hypothetical protein
MLINKARFSLVNASAISKSASLLIPFRRRSSSHHVTARRVTLRKTLPFDQQTTRFPSSFWSFSRSAVTVVPCSRRPKPSSCVYIVMACSRALGFRLKSMQYLWKPRHTLTLPVPESPHNTTTPPPPPFPSTLPLSCLTSCNISLATSSGLFPKTSIDIYSSGTKFGSSTPLALEISIPFCNLLPSSSSRRSMLDPSDSDRRRKVAEDDDCCEV